MGYDKQNPETIQSMFGSIAKDYDRGNAILSFQMHKWWNSQLIKHVLTPTQPESFLDLCAGTGDIALTYLNKKQKAHDCKGVLLDFCKEMLDIAQIKAQQMGIRNTVEYVVADAQQIPFEEKSFNAVTVAYGIRNVKDFQKCFREVFRVLKPGGRFGILELTQPENKILRLGHNLYLKNVLPLAGKMFTSNENAYKYLCQSIQHFVAPQVLEAGLKEAGFKNIQRISLLGGVATLIVAQT
jgi:demethylmenaquinone methyltransferase/2-methoxy-6-polyprenyl-1,4-benzoquinol methylase